MVRIRKRVHSHSFMHQVLLDKLEGVFDGVLNRDKFDISEYMKPVSCQELNALKIVFSSLNEATAYMIRSLCAT